MSQDDSYEPAIDLPDTGDSDTIGTAGDGAALEVREVVRDRGVKETTRKLFATAASKLKQQLDSDGGTDDLEPAITDDPPVAAAAASASPDASKVPPPSAAAAAPASDPVAQVVDTSRAAQVELRERELEARTRELAAREESLAARENARERYIEAPATFLRDMIKEWTGAATDDELRDEVADLITELSSHVLGAQVPETHKTRIDARRAVRQVKAYKADQAKRDAELAKRAEQQQQERAELDAMRGLGAELDRVKDKYPHLAAEEDAGAILWAVIKQQHAQTGQTPNWEDMAAKANEHFEKKNRAYFAKRGHLLAPAAPPPAASASVPQGDPQSRRSATLTNKTAAPVPPASSSDDVAWDRDAQRRRSLAHLRGAMKEDA